MSNFPDSEPELFHLLNKQLNVSEVLSPFVDIS